MENKAVFGIAFLKGDIKIEKSAVYDFHTHTHLYNEMIFYEPFAGHITVNNMKITVDTPTVALITASDFHSTHTYGECSAKCLKISFANDMVSPFFLKKINAPIILKNYTSDSIFKLLLEKIQSGSAEFEYKKIVLNSILLELCESGDKLQSADKMNIKGIVIDAVNMINLHFNENITLESAAARLNVTPQYLSAAFSKTMDISFSHYLSDIRLRYAAGMLSDNTLNVTEICYLSGYRNLSHFIRAFKRKYGITPNAFKGKNE